MTSLWMSRRTPAPTWSAAWQWRAAHSPKVSFPLAPSTTIPNDIINIFYTETKYSFPITKDISTSSGFGLLDQLAVYDKELLNGRSSPPIRSA